MASWIDRDPAFQQRVTATTRQPVSDGRSHYPGFCPVCRCIRTFNPDRCVVCGHLGGHNGELLPVAPGDRANVALLRRRDLDGRRVGRSAGRRYA